MRSLLVAGVSLLLVTSAMYPTASIAQECERARALYNGFMSNGGSGSNATYMRQQMEIICGLESGRPASPGRDASSSPRSTYNATQSIESSLERLKSACDRGQSGACGVYEEERQKFFNSYDTMSNSDKGRFDAQMRTRGYGQTAPHVSAACIGVERGANTNTYGAFYTLRNRCGVSVDVNYTCTGGHNRGLGDDGRAFMLEDSSSDAYCQMNSGIRVTSVSSR